MKLKNKLILNITLTNLVIFTVTALFISISSEKNMKKSLKNQIADSRDLITTHIDGVLNHASESYIACALDGIFLYLENSTEVYSEEVAKKMVLQQVQNIKLGESGYVYVTNTEGTVIHHPVEQVGKKMSVLTDWVKENSTEKRPVLDYTYQNKKKKLIKAYYAPWDWQVMATVYLDDFSDLVNIDSLNEQMKKVKIGERGYPVITDQNGVILTHISDDIVGKDITGIKDANGIQFLSNMLTKDFDSITYEWKEDSGKIENKFLEYYKFPGTGWYLLITGYWSDFYEGINFIKTLLIVTMFIAIVINFIIIRFIAKSITKPIIHLSNIIEDISEGDGDLTREINVNANDEVGIMATNLNKFIFSLNNMMKDIKDSSDNNLIAKNDLENVSETSIKSMGDISTNIVQINSKVNEFNHIVLNTEKSINNIINNIIGLDSSIDSQTSMIEQSTASITEIIASITSVSEITQKKYSSTESLISTAKIGRNIISETNTAISEVKSQLANINEMSNIILDIADRTNLLSINAAIEAAHAGDSGKGFAVVSEEIKNLAILSSDSSEQIQNTITNITESINYTYDNSVKAENSFKLIQKEISDVVNALNEIVLSTREIHTGGQEMLDSISFLSEVSQQVKTNSTQIRKSTDKVSINMNDTVNMTSKVLTDVEDITLCTKGIQESLDSFTNNLKMISDSTFILNNNVNKFKIRS